MVDKLVDIKQSSFFQKLVMKKKLLKEVHKKCLKCTSKKSVYKKIWKN